MEKRKKVNYIIRMTVLLFPRIHKSEVIRIFANEQRI